jgi:hypothetical protein
MASSGVKRSVDGAADSMQWPTNLQNELFCVQYNDEKQQIHAFVLIISNGNMPSEW